MRLRILEHGHRPRNRLALRLMRAVAGTEPDDVIKTSLYRPRFFGRPWVRLLRRVMRGESEWSPGERELFAAFTSRLNTCRYCVGIHVGTAALAFDAAITAERLDNWREAGFAPKVAATLGLLEKVTLTPDDVSADDIERVAAAGVSEAAIVDALYVCFLFNLVNRLANALGYDWGTEADALKAAAVLMRVGYRLPGSGFLLS
jgi:uncharacterized peroxidase-related enzyme